MRNETTCSIRFAARDEWEEAMGLAWKTFLEFEAPDYTPAGIKSFEDFITDTDLRRMFIMGAYQLMGAYVQDKLVGIVSLRSESHISLLFVDKEYHRQGIGSALIQKMADYVRDELGKKRMTVNAAPYAEPFYHRVGFKDVGVRQQSDGIIYTPMEYAL